MLLKIREVTAGKFSYFIIAIISVPFALWGINYYFQGGDGPVVIEVDSTEITLGRYNQAFNQRKRALEASLEFAEMPSDENIKRDVIGALVRDELLRKTVEEYRYQVPDAEVASAIVRMPDFINEGRFDKQQYLDLLNANRQSQAGFEKNVKDQLLKNQLYQVIDQSSFVLPYEEDMYNKFLSQERHVRYLEFPVAHFIDPDSVSSTETRAYYEDHKREFLHSDAFYLQYIELKMDEIAAGLSAEENDLRAYYDDNSDLFTVPEQRIVAHILIALDRHENVEERAREIYEKLELGEDFADLAKTYSDDDLTANKGGELLPLRREDLDDVAEEAIFSLSPGEFSEPVSGDFGLQIFKLLSVRDSEIKTFEEVRGVVEETFIREETERLYHDTLDQIESLAYQHQDGLLLIAKEVALVGGLQRTGLIKVDEKKGIFQYPEVVEAAYSDEVKNQLNSPVLEVAPGHVIVITGGGGREGPYRPGAQETFEEVEQEIIEILLQDKAWEQASRAVEEAAKNLQENNATLDDLAERQSLPLHDVGFIRRKGLPEIPAVEQAAFLMRETTPSHANIRMQTAESYAIVELVEAREGRAPETENDEENRALSFAIEEFNAVLLGILEESSVEVHTEHFEDETL